MRFLMILFATGNNLEMFYLAAGQLFDKCQQ